MPHLLAAVSLPAGFKDENGVLPRDAIRKQFNGSLFYEYAAKMGKSMKEKKVSVGLILCQCAPQLLSMLLFLNVAVYEVCTAVLQLPVCQTASC